MTDDRLPLADLLAKAGDGDFLRSVDDPPMTTPSTYTTTRDATSTTASILCPARTAAI